MSIVKKSDKAMGRMVYVASSLYNSPYYKGRRKEHFSDAADKLADIVDHARRLLDLPKILKVRVANMLKSDAVGCYYWSYNTIQLASDLMCQPKNLCTVMVHELIHAEQHFTGRLTVVESTSEHIWNDGVNVQCIRKWAPSDYTAYRNLPWEKEAYDRQDAIVDEIFIEHFS